MLLGGDRIVASLADLSGGRHLADLCLSAPQVVTSTFGDESVSLGAVRFALDHVERDVLGL
ncbi:hypothetical protein [Nonomuraea glycinis]|uniref:hypothetical protein n=1 Tax=Nonomuraea glycinis TaxID=2047744 RepID=UPI002E164B95|nr:hypothetical protein OHA68_24145 [Nonomuraea glycinis]